ncbi:hypothetical protein [Roseomonas indoligenes]|uniref:Uncharacterized protein n=1 Tax=Roseomonas indoligenes TaxID=2820811 RepID=A0A940MYI4_9PROT|nr:hypothetical protein [Pararoseomonas indoligenes]MBP0492781.1 hypothetical protein [Pararoseomonas indoligenes]
MPFPSPPDELDPATLAAARPLDLCRSPASPGAVALVDDLVAFILAHEAGPASARKTKRREAGKRELCGALGAVAGSLLDAWGGHGEPRPAYRSKTAAGFSGGPVGYRAFVATMGALVTLELVREHGGKRFQTEGWDPASPLSKGWAARFWPRAALLELAEQHGVSPATVRQDFRLAPPSKPPKVKDPVDLRPFVPEGWGADRPKPRLVASKSDELATLIAADVGEHNAMAERVTVTGCTPPRWKRVFHGAWELHGRWYAAGADGVYQTMPQALRGALTIGGEPVVELDVQAAHLAILRGLCGLGPVEGDPYHVEGVPRAASKRWLLEALGKGKAVERWSRRTPDADRAQDAKVIRAAMLKRHPCLGDPGVVVSPALAARLGVSPEELVSPFLAAREAAAMSWAMRELRGRGVLALPVHDSLIVPASARAEATGSIVEGFRRVCGIAPRVETKSALPLSSVSGMREGKPGESSSQPLR